MTTTLTYLKRKGKPLEEVWSTQRGVKVLRMGKTKKKIGGETFVFHGTTFSKANVSKYKKIARDYPYKFRAIKRYNKTLGTHYQMWIKKKKKRRRRRK